MEPLLPHYLNFKVHENNNRITDYLKMYTGEGFNHICIAYSPHQYYPVLGEIEHDDSKLRSISVGISNWDRDYYIPYILNMYYFQDYPKELLEFVIVDEDSPNKADILEMIKQQAVLYPEFKIKYIQLNENVFQNGCKRANTCMRFSSNSITIFNPSDSILLGTNFLRGITHSCSVGRYIHVVPLPYQTSYGQNVCPMELPNIQAVFNMGINVHWRLGSGLLTAVNTEVAKEMNGLDENEGNGGFEGNFLARIGTVGGLMYVNTEIAGMDLPNWPFSRSAFTYERKFLKRGDWTNSYSTNNPDWGITDKMEIYEFNQ